ncbi:MAG TPA: NAD(P)H-hydrate epimerase [Petrotogaceae bacterium]|nr:NAD(P)H-hydrate epimerase [Petrotogaceae bacterium]
MKILTASQAKDMDLQTIKKGISEDTLIEQAAYSVFEVVAELRPLKVLCVAGAGNNGADSICTARILANNSIYFVPGYIFSIISYTISGFLLWTLFSPRIMLLNFSPEGSIEPFVPIKRSSCCPKT